MTKTERIEFGTAKAKRSVFPVAVESPETRSSSTSFQFEYSRKLGEKFCTAVCECRPGSRTSVTSDCDPCHLRLRCFSSRIGPVFRNAFHLNQVEAVAGCRLGRHRNMATIAVVEAQGAHDTRRKFRKSERTPVAAD